MPAPGGVRWAPLESGDWPVAQELLIESERHDRTGPRILHGWRHQLAPITDEQAYTLAARADDGTIVALGWLSMRPHDEPPRRVFLAGTVHPEFRRRGLGRRLLDWQVEAARRWQRSVSGDPITIVASTSPLPDVRRLLTGAGFSPARVFAELSRTLPRASSEADQRALSLSKGSSQIAVAPFSSDRAEEVRDVLNASFADHWGARTLQPEPWQAVLAAATFRPDWSWLALDQSRVVGFVLNSAAPHPELGSVGWTDQLGVLPQTRGRGVGGALMKASLASFERAGPRLAGLGVDSENPFGATALYRRLGYRWGFQVHLFTRTEPTSSIANWKPMS